jgi:hypothetical protein
MQSISPITNDQLRQSADQASSKLEGMKRDHEHFNDTTANRDKQISFLEGHLAQLTQSISQLSLTPGEEEIKKRAGGNSGNEEDKFAYLCQNATTKVQSIRFRSLLRTPVG